MSAWSPFGELTPAGFLEHYWQKRPLVVRGALPQLTGVIAPEDLAGLACEPDVESRLIRGDGRHESFSLAHGPFTEADFLSLPERDWTVLVQDVEKHLPAMAEALAPFRFLPDWRVDDLMVSYAAPGGSAGPHVDQYDVFLVQASGERHWAIQEAAEAVQPLEDSALRLVADFDPTAEWLLEPGDLLYLPPGIPHHGVARSPCVTLSVGFRAPSYRELLTGFLDEIVLGTDPELRYGDPDLRPQALAGELTPAALERLRGIIRDHLTVDDERLDRWLGRFLTEVPGEGFDHPDGEPDTGALRRVLAEGTRLVRNPAARLALLRSSGGRVLLFVNGEELTLRRGLVPLGEQLAAWMPLDDDAVAAAPDPSGALELLATLFAAGAVIPEEP